MSTPTEMLGSNLRPGQQRGGFTAPRYEGKKPSRDRLKQDHKQIIEAANAALERRGVHQWPSEMRDQISRACAERRGKQEPIA